MKRHFKITYIIMAIAIFSAAFSILAVDSSAAADDGMVWKVTHANSKVDYYDSFDGAFETITEGDVFELIPDSYELTYNSSSDNDFASVVANGNITIDIRDSVIYCNATGDVAAQMFNISSKNGSTVKILMENAVIYVPSGGRTAFSVSGSAIADIDGGKAGGKIFAPGALNLTANYSSESMCTYMRNIYAYKSSHNMAGMISARNTSNLKLIDCYAVGLDTNNPPLYIVDSGELTLENSVAISIGGGDAVKFNNTKSGATLAVGKGTCIYGKVTGITDLATITVDDDTFFTQDLSAYVTGYRELVAGEVILPYTCYISTAIGSYSTSSVDLTFGYRVIPSYDLEDEYSEGLLWKLGDADGNIKYSSSLVPVKLSPGKYTEIALLEDIVTDETIRLELSSSLALDLSGRMISSKDKASSFTLFDVSGIGTLTVNMSNAVIDLGRASLMRVLGFDSMSVSASGAYVNASGAFITSGTDVSIDGGYYTAASGCAVRANYASLILKGLTVYASAVICGEDATVFEGVKLLPPLGTCALEASGTASLAAGTLISGSVEAKEIFMSGTVRLGGSPVAEKINMLAIEDKVKETVAILELKNGKLENVNKTFDFKYRTAEINEDIRFNFTFRSYVALNVYIPKGIAESNKNFALRLNISGLLLDAGIADAVNTVIDGKTYKCFTYKYVYPTSCYDEAALTLISGDFNYSSKVPLMDLLDRSFAAADDSVKAVIATYAAYALDVSASKLPDDSPMKEYVRDFTKEERITEQIEKYVDHVRYDVPSQKLVISPKERLGGTILIVYNFGEEQMRYSFSLDSEFSLPVYRLNNGKAISAAVDINGGTERFMFDLYTLIAFMPEDSSSRHDLMLYAAYLASVQDAIK